MGKSPFFVSSFFHIAADSIQVCFLQFDADTTEFSCQFRDGQRIRDLVAIHFLRYEQGIAFQIQDRDFTIAIGGGGKIEVYRICLKLEWFGKDLPTLPIGVQGQEAIAWNGICPQIPGSSLAYRPKNDPGNGAYFKTASTNIPCPP